jgi:hypothetical protein
MMERDRESENEGIPQSQRVTITTPMPFVGINDRVRPKTVGAYMIINEAALERRRNSISR